MTHDPRNPPRLMLVSKRKLSENMRRIVKESFEEWLRGSQAAVVIEEMDVYQLVDGRWQPVTPVSVPDPSPDQIVTTEL